MTPAEAWMDGHHAGREEMAASANSDAAERDTADARKLAAMERRLLVAENEARDNARSVVDLTRRMAIVEDGMISPPPAADNSEKGKETQ